MRIGVVGYGSGGRHFHVPFILAARGVSLAGVVARAPETVTRVQADLPGTPIYPSLSAMLSAEVDAVTIITPPHTRRDLVLEAITAGMHVIADKPFAPDAAGGRWRKPPAGKASRLACSITVAGTRIRTDAPPPVTVKEAIATLAILDAARISAAEGRSVAIGSVSSPCTQSRPQSGAIRGS